MTNNGTLTIRRVNTADSGGYMQIVAHVPGSAKPAVVLSIAPRELMLALTGLAVPVEIAPERVEVGA